MCIYRQPKSARSHQIQNKSSIYDVIRNAYVLIVSRELISRFLRYTGGGRKIVLVDRLSRGNFALTWIAKILKVMKTIHLADRTSSILEGLPRYPRGANGCRNNSFARQKEPYFSAR